MPDYGDISSLSIDEVLPYFIQQHLSRSAGTHYDLRFGKDRLFSFATKDDLPTPGTTARLYQTPLHSRTYTEKAEAGKVRGDPVKPVRRGSLRVEEVSPGRLAFSTTGEKPQTFMLTRAKITKGPGFKWILTNSTAQSEREDDEQDNTAIRSVSLQNADNSKKAARRVSLAALKSLLSNM